MNKEYKFMVNKLDLRSAIDTTTKKPTYTVSGYAQIPNKKDIYKFGRDKNTGKVKLFRSMFTDNCIKSLKKQAKFKKIFVDSNHELGVNANIKSLLKDRISEEEMEKVDSWLKMKKLPFAKIDELNIDDKGLFVKTSLNNAFPDVDEDHRRYYDAIVSSLQHKYINGLSTTIVPTKVIGTDEDLKIDDAVFCGVSYVDQPALTENNIVEVAMRAAQEFRTGENMEENKEELEKIKAEADAAKKEAEDAKAEVEKMKKAEEDKTKAEEDAKNKSMEEQMKEQKEINENLQKEMEKLKEGKKPPKEGEEETEGQQGTSGEGQSKVKEDQDKYGQAAQKGKEKYDGKFYEEQIKDITKDHDETIKEGKGAMVDNRMVGFGKMINLQAQVGSSISHLPERDRQNIDEYRLLNKGDSDVIVNRN